MSKRNAIIIMVASLLGTTSIAPVLADSHSAADAAEVQAMSAAKLSIAEASAAAEGQFGGKTVEVSLDVINGAPVYMVSLRAADGTEMGASVDAVTGAVTTAPVDVADNETGDNETGDDAEDSENGSENEGENGENGGENEAQ